MASEGYVYVPDDAAGVMTRARVGAKIVLHERRPPWIVVDHSINSVVVAQWPGQLWRVAVTDALGIEQASADARYTRAFEVKVLECIPVSRLFGERGKAVCSVIAASTRLELPEIKLLASARHPRAEEAYSRAWKGWLNAVDGTQAKRQDNLRGTLGISAGGSQSPINHGLMVLYQAISNRAEELVGPSAFVVSEDGDKYLEPTWGAACEALLEAAMGFGAPLVSDEDRHILTAAWRSVIREIPDN